MHGLIHGVKIHVNDYGGEILFKKRVFHLGWFNLFLSEYHSITIGKSE